MRVALSSLASRSGGGSFIRPFIGVENVGIHVLAAGLRERGHKVELIDAVALGLSLEEVKLRLRSFRPEFIGMSPTLSVMPETIELAAFAKGLSPIPVVAIGGHHASLTARAILEHEPDIDVVSVGEADVTLPALTAALEEGRDLEEVAGLAFRRLGYVVATGSAPTITCLDDLPFMSRDTLFELRARGGLVGANIQAARGCPYSCAFCSTPTFVQGGPRYRRRSVESVIAEMAEVVEHHGVHLFNFTDDIFLVPNELSLQWAREFSQGIRSRGLEVAIAVMLRAEMLREEHSDAIRELVEAGLQHVLIGIESASARTLSFFEKGTSMSDYEQAIAFLRDQRVFLACAFICLEPHTRPADVIENVRFLRDVAEDPMLYHYVSQLTVFPGTPVEAKLEREGLLLDSALPYRSGRSYRFTHPVTALLAQEFSRVSSRLIAGDVQLDRVRFTLGHARAAGAIDAQVYRDRFDELGARSRRIAGDHGAFVERCVAFAEAGQRSGLRREVEGYVRTYAEACTVALSGWDPRRLQRSPELTRPCSRELTHRPHGEGPARAPVYYRHAVSSIGKDS